MTCSYEPWWWSCSGMCLACGDYIHRDGNSDKMSISVLDWVIPTFGNRNFECNIYSSKRHLCTGTSDLLVQYSGTGIDISSWCVILHWQFPGTRKICKLKMDVLISIAYKSVHPNPILILSDAKKLRTLRWQLDTFLWPVGHSAAFRDRWSSFFGTS